MLPRILMLSACLASLGGVAQRRRDRTRSGISGQQDLPSSSSRALFEEPQTSSSFVETQSFFPEFDWAEPSFADMGSLPEWGMKKTAARQPQAQVEEEAVQDKSDRVDAGRRFDVVSRPAPDRGNRRSLIGVRAKANSYRGQGMEDRYEDRFKGVLRTRTRERFRPPTQPPVEQEVFRPASRLEGANPGNL